VHKTSSRSIGCYLLRVVSFCSDVIPRTEIRVVFTAASELQSRGICPRPGGGKFKGAPCTLAA